MKKIPLTKGKYAIIDDEDYELVSKFRWKPHRLKNNIYAITVMSMGVINHKKQLCRVFLHRLIMHPPEGFDVDHKNNIGLDCRKKNMRICSRSQNNQNRHKSRGFSKYKGVCFIRGYGRQKRWLGRIKYYGKEYVKYCMTEIEAAHAYDRIALQYFGEFANTNFPRSNYV